MRTVCRVYDSYAQARAAVDAVQGAGVPASDISLVANKYVSAEHADVHDIPEAAKGAGIGAATGGIVGALVDAGVDHEHAAVYSETVRRGGTMVTVRVPDEHAGRVAALLESYKPIDPLVRGAEYRNTGWQTFDEKAAPYRPSQAEIDRMRANWPG